MTKRVAVTLASCLALVACGGDSGGNAAAGKTFTYGSASTYSPYSIGPMGSEVSSSLTIQGGMDGTSTQDLASVDALADSLLGSSGVAVAPTQREALAAGARAASRQLSAGGSYQFDNSSCVAATTGSVTMTGCVYTPYSYYGETEKVYVDGKLSYDATKGTLTYDFTVKDVVSYQYNGQTLSETVALNESGAITMDATTIKGQMLASLSVSGNYGGQSADVAVDVAVNLDVTYTDPVSCSTRIVGGTLEAKRVWTNRAGALASALPDKAALVTWTGCGQGTVAYSWK